MPILSIKNVGKGPRGCRPLRGLVVLEPGAEIEAEFSDAEAASLARNGEFTVLGTAAPVSNETDTPAAQASALLAKVADMPFLSFKSAATKILGPDAPATKAELVAALLAKAD